MKLRKEIMFSLVGALLISCFSGISNERIESKAGEITVSNPRYIAEGGVSGIIAEWDCIWLGNYPQAEVIPEDEEYDNLTESLIREGDLIASNEEYEKLESATGWDENGDIIIDGGIYRRISKKDVSDPHYGEGYYEWEFGDEYHYFKYESIKWRVLAVEGDRVLILSDIALDCMSFNDSLSPTAVWADSGIRQKLNESFFEDAFEGVEKEGIVDTLLSTADNNAYGTDGGADTIDKVFLLANEDVMGNSEKAQQYGFATEDYYKYAGLHCNSSTYAKALGLYCNTTDGYAGGTINWWLRSPGADDLVEEDDLQWNCMEYVCRLLGTGSTSSNSYNAVRPALYVDKLFVEEQIYPYAGTVNSDIDGVIPEGGPSATPDHTPPMNTVAPKITLTPNSTPETSTEAVAENDITTSPSPIPTGLSDGEEIGQNDLSGSGSLFEVKGLKVKQNEKQCIELSWKKEKDAEGYLVLRSNKKNGKYSLCVALDYLTNSYIDEKVKVGKKYYYKVLPYVGDISPKQYQTTAPVRKIKVYPLYQPVIQVKKAKTSSGQKYVEISLKKYQGDYAQIYYKDATKKKYQKLPIKKGKILDYRKKYRLRYERGGVTLCFKVRTYVVKKGTKKYSGYSKVVRKKI